MLSFHLLEAMFPPNGSTLSAQWKHPFRPMDADSGVHPPMIRACRERGFDKVFEPLPFISN